MPDSYLRVTNHFLRNDEYETATDLLEKAIERGADSPDIHNNLMVLFNGKKDEEDKAKFEKYKQKMEEQTSKESSIDPTSRFNIGVLHMKEVKRSDTGKLRKSTSGFRISL